MSAMPSGSPADWLAEFPPPRSLTLDQEATRVYERAYYIGVSTEKPDDPPVTFSTVLLALLISDDETSRWFTKLAGTNGPLLTSVCSEKGIASGGVTSINASKGRPSPLRLSNDKQLLTLSARSVLQTAEEWANRVGGSDIGVRHLVAAYVLNPPDAHRKQMLDWGYKDHNWRTEFFNWVPERFTAESWSDASQKVAPTKAVPSFEQPKVKGAALAFPGDALAMEVLGRAAEFHARRKDKDNWLRLQTVFFALVEQARASTALREAITPIWSAVEKIETKYKSALDAYVSATPAAETTPFEALDISPRVLNSLGTARELARASPHAGATVGALQLAGAIISRRVDGDEDLIAVGFDPCALRRALIDHAAANDESAEIWREALGEEETALAGRPVDLNSDEPEAAVRADLDWTSDPLGIRPDVASFAALLASRSLGPPLAIGLFGPWGSGKTTFIKRLRREIDKLTNAKPATDATTPTPFVRNVVHVEFNAWHFAEDALISSLIDTIVRELRAFIKNDYQKVGTALEELKAQTAETARRRVQAAKESEANARSAVTTATTKVAESEAAARAGAASLSAAVQAAWNATLAAVKDSPAVKESSVLEHLGDSVKSLDELRARVDSVRSRPGRLIGNLGWVGTLVFAAIVLVVPPAVAWLVGRVFSTSEIGQALTAASAALSVVVIWLRAASSAANRVDQALAKIAAEYEKTIREDPAVQAAERDLAAAAKSAEAASAALAGAERTLRAAEAEAAAASLPAQMLSLVAGRVSDQTYAKELTTISIARQDLNTLSQVLRKETPATTTPAGVRPVDRVILYIDDLDRCKPEDVVRVLQVVHMLLAFELFVVVVAVDARWVEESLRQNYKWLSGAAATTDENDRKNGKPAAGGGPRVTPQDYLEKIFQISFWLEPMTSARAAEYLKALVRTSGRESGSVVSTPVGPDGRVEIVPIELDYMRALAAYVGPSPRRVKRLVNAYRLLKARLSDAQLASFLADRQTDGGGLRSGPYQLVIGLLVIGTGAPASAAPILRELAERNPGDTFDSVIDEFRERNDADWTMAAVVLETMMRTQKAKDVAELRGWARRVGRFLLQGPKQELGERGAAPAPAAPANP
jgi:hypothetical protein